MKNRDAARQFPLGYILLNTLFLRKKLNATDNNLTAGFIFNF